MRLAARLAHDDHHELTLTIELVNDERAPQSFCVRDPPLANLYGFWGLDADVKCDGTRVSLQRLFNPAWGAPAPPLLSRAHVDAALVTIATGEAATIALRGCLLPRPLLPAALDGEWLFALGTTAEKLRATFAAGELPYGTPIALLPPARRYELVVRYRERRDFGFVPPRPIELEAPPIALTSG